MTETIIGGDTFNIVVEGAAESPAILLAHSLGTNLHVFDRQVAALMPHYRLIRYDMRGHGGSRVSAGPYSIDQLGRDALSILDALKIEKAHFIGVSAGGLVGLWLLRNAPERLDRAVLANVAAQIGSPEFWSERIRAVEENGLSAVAADIAESWFTKSYREQYPDAQRLEDALAAMDSAGYASAAAAVRDADFRHALADIAHAVLVVVGRHDAVTPPGVGALVASAISGAKTVSVEAAHLSPIEAAEAFNDAVLEFLGNTETNATPSKPSEARSSRPPRPKRALRAGPGPEPDMAGRRAEAPATSVSPRKTRGETSARKAPAKKEAAKKRTAKKAQDKRMARRAVVKKRVGRKGVVKKIAARGLAARKTGAKKLARKSTSKKAARKVAKRVIKKTPAKKPARKSKAGRAPARKTAARKTLKRRGTRR